LIIPSLRASRSSASGRFRSDAVLERGVLLLQLGSSASSCFAVPDWRSQWLTGEM
jgi:hypothetical protein